MPEISVQAANGSRERYPLMKERVRIGRARDTDIAIPDQWLSRYHAEIRRRDDEYYIADLGSKNGTLVNDVRLAGEQRLTPGDRINLGDFVLTFTWDEPVDPDEDVDHLDTVSFQFQARRFSDVETKSGIDVAEVTRQSRVLGILTRTASALLVHRNVDEICGFLLDQLFEAVPAERGAILLLEGEPPQLVTKAKRSGGGPGDDVRISRSISRRVLDQQVSLLLPNVLDDPELRSKESVLRLGIRSAVCAPLWFTAESEDRDRVIGLVYLDTLQGSYSFTEEDLRILTALANVAASKIETGRLLKESVEKRFLEEDLRKAAEIQLGLLPSSAPEVRGYGLVGTTQACRAVGGDYYDLLMAGDQLLFALADVSGKGTGAALLTTVLRAAVRAHWTEFPLAEAMARINRTVCQNVPENRYITFFMARLEPATGRLQYVNAGQNPPLLIHASGDVETLEEGGMVLGMFEPVAYVTGAAEMRPGDILAAYSDGVTETFSPDGEEFGEQRLREVIVRNGHSSARALQDEILRELDAWSHGARTTDDRTLMVLKRV
jgi:serine phosphatase RsbU (regulator of sigma subunit)/pSer/pThr/pTyr-binding forkhead associated (FHA) protein